MRNVTFGYKDDGSVNAIALHNINTQIIKGQVAVLVSPSSGGKSMIIKLLLGFYPMNTGNTIIDGKPIGQWPLTLLRKMILFLFFGLCGLTYSQIVELPSEPTHTDRSGESRSKRHASIHMPSNLMENLMMRSGRKPFSSQTLFKKNLTKAHYHEIKPRLDLLMMRLHFMLAHGCTVKIQRKFEPSSHGAIKRGVPTNLLSRSTAIEIDEPLTALG